MTGPIRALKGGPVIRFLMAALILVISAATARAQSVRVQVDTFSTQRPLGPQACVMGRDSLPVCPRPDSEAASQPPAPAPPAGGPDSDVHVDIKERSVSEPVATPDARRKSD